MSSCTAIESQDTSNNGKNPPPPLAGGGCGRGGYLTTAICSRRNCTVSSSSALPMRSSISSTSASVMISGGLKQSDVARHRAADHAVLLDQLGQAGRRSSPPGRSSGASSLSATSSIAGDQADAAHLAHQRMVGEAPAQLLLHVRADCADMLADVHLVVDLQRLDRDRRRHRMAGIGEAVAERADLVALLRQALEHALVHHHRADRQIGRGQRLGAGQDVGLHVAASGCPSSCRCARSRRSPRRRRTARRTCAAPPGSSRNTSRGGTITPPAPMTGSAHIAATVSGPSARISFSSSSAQRVANASSLSPGLAP